MSTSSSSSLLPDLAGTFASLANSQKKMREGSTSSTDDAATDRSVTPNVTEDAKRLANDAEEFIQNSDNKQLIQFGLMAIGAVVVLKTIVQSIVIILFLLGPMAYVYLVQTCPTESSFDGKKELKRILRGHHLPEDHPEKPKGYFGKMAAKVTASVQTNVMTAMPGCEQEMTSYKGAFRIVSMKVPSANMQCYWIGALSSWRYVHSRELSTAQRKND
mmetsp:Transcript_106486/g.159292  ORF Transcript_106486/g.159292 Transcript_106486/m.159292 type:complete len:217 (+) Transcript_106486:77-727(+)|eukprot:CAMPEP_0117036454 /NCGR_PEP_ID=MMETSP0472-20121206/25824_1 /TAXON_ID=693140 ORGANISM="Tiarina fusus, Strain LIS" /NCGR_SAMPLE_ID=MMETSP0472 /ASSEMBLY_ACC=CAM_ASM_000603 /LENGTH=216 /DNA_ID=CAMNT_0004746219 /DNA_START=72 /DNA_END=722 /DNA_ORIENTATION=-